ncbi:WD repeat-containing protein 63-like [Ceratina calcarata]|uniref:WD repeat-containing protein 63-like n=1 Tax=Ceratina calcarata TaxID=156304 RepID=A0AAJ7NF62_9HYME|nr:WD repeat-containing protein 63-like [Ceratina calcarata]
MIWLLNGSSVVAEVNGMPRKRVKSPHGWTLVDENIENVEHLKLDRKTQRELGCLVGEHVFLEYPWAFVPRDVIVRFAKIPDSPLAPFQEEIEIYKSDTFLLGYSSDQLISDDFVICLTEKAKHFVRQTNKNITNSILNRVISKVIKTSKSWKSLGSDIEVDETFVKNTRDFFEIEIVVPGKILGSCQVLTDRNANDTRDSCVQLVNADEKFENIERKCISKSIQTHLQSRETAVQTHISYPRNAWTQYVYKDTLNEAPAEDLEDPEEEEQLQEEAEGNGGSLDKHTCESKETDEETRERTPLELFLDDGLPEMIDTIKYNAAVNLHVDDVQNLSQDVREVKTFSSTPMFCEQLSVINLNLTVDKAVSDVSVHNALTEYIAISYRTWKNGCAREGEFQTRVLIWNLNDPLRPLLALQDHREIYSVSFSPRNDSLVLGGCSTGQIVIWNIHDHLCTDRNTKLGVSLQNNLPMFRPIVVSDKHGSHRSSVRKIQWIPAKYRVEPNGKLTKPSISSTVQFLTVSKDGTVYIWDLRPDDEDSHELLQPTLRLVIRISNEKSVNFSPLCVCLPSISVLREQNSSSRDVNKFDLKEEDYLKSLWIGCAEGLIKCSWKEQELEEKSAEIIECDTLYCSYAHDGPVTEITRSPHLQNILLTVGGQVFAIWSDNYMDSPLFWRKTCSKYTTCCWANEPGVFLLGSQDGSLEVWDIKNESNKPVLLQVVSTNSITHLILLESSVFGSAKMFGVGDRGGLFRVLKEPEIVSCNDALERMDWFEEYAWRELRRKKVFTVWQNDFLANDPAVIAKRSARRDAERKREAEEARERLRREQEARLRLEIEKRARDAPIPKDIAWKSKQFDRMKEDLLNKKKLIPSVLEAKRLPLVVLNAEREAKLEKVREKIAHRDAYFLNELSAEFLQILESKVEVAKFEKAIKLEKSTDDYMQRFTELKRRFNEEIANLIVSDCVDK